MRHSTLAMMQTRLAPEEETVNSKPVVHSSPAPDKSYGTSMSSRIGRMPSKDEYYKVEEKSAFYHIKSFFTSMREGNCSSKFLA
jgi:hypothetical protein